MIFFFKNALLVSELEMQIVLGLQAVFLLSWWDLQPSLGANYSHNNNKKKFLVTPTSLAVMQFAGSACLSESCATFPLPLSVSPVCWPEPKCAFPDTLGLPLFLWSLPCPPCGCLSSTVWPPARIAGGFLLASPFSSSGQLLRFIACLPWGAFL